jgi:P27 family predicted phage terminase small subunit
MPGPARKPTRLRLIQGNPSKRPLNKREPQPKVGVPPCPKHLDAEAKREWIRMSRQLEPLGLLTVIDRAALAAYCQAWSRWVEAETLVSEHGLILTSPNGYPMPSPYVTVANKAMRAMHSLLVEFGMTPSSRSRIKVGEPAKVDPFDDLLTG